MQFRCRNDVDLEPKEPKIDNQCGLSQSDTIRASDIWRGRHARIHLSAERKISFCGADVDGVANAEASEASGAGISVLGNLHISIWINGTAITMPIAGLNGYVDFIFLATTCALTRIIHPLMELFAFCSV